MLLKRFAGNYGYPADNVAFTCHFLVLTGNININYHSVYGFCFIPEVQCE
jgi:hypothetical protein